MRREEFAYWVTTTKPIPEAVAAVEAKAAEVEAIIRAIVDEAAGTPALL